MNLVLLAFAAVAVFTSGGWTVAVVLDKPNRAECVRHALFQGAFGLFFLFTGSGS